MNTVICPFSGDPITYGHIDIIERAAHTFPHVIAAIGINPLKQYLFTIGERLQMAKAALAYLPNVEVDCYEGLLADFARQKGTSIVVRGIRNGEDFNYEWMLHQINESIDNTLETFWIPCRKEMESISSTSARNGWKQGDNISALVPPVVVQMLQAKR
ncbi:MAG TPA: pantetheine-phosphate adenylyltransferase [Chitinophagales bacterium]|nr:pantetheine-phosphate adenylyltransferase [Chitinophagales bacterium]